MTNNVIPTCSLGMGFITESQMCTATYCVDLDNINTVRSIGKSTSVQEVKYGMSFSDLAKDLSVNLALEMDSFNLALAYAKNTRSTDYSYSFTYKFKVDFATQALQLTKAYGEELLNDFGKGALAAGRFFDACGDKFIIQENYEALLYATFKLTFRSKWDAQDFSFDGNFGGMVSVALDSHESSESKNINLEMYSLQMGGDVLQLAKILYGPNFQDVTHVSGTETVMAPMLECNLKSKAGTDKCLETFDNILRYAQTDFVEQIYLPSSNLSDGTYPPSSKNYVYKYYKDIGVLSSGILNLEKYQKYYPLLIERLESIKLTVDNVLLSDPLIVNIKQNIPNSPWTSTWTWDSRYLNIEESIQLKYAKKLATNIGEILDSSKYGIIACYKDPSVCDRGNNTITQMLELEDQGRTVKAAAQLVNIDQALKDTGVFYTLGKVYLMKVNCNSDGQSNVENIYTERVLFPIGQNSYYEDTKFTKSADPLVTKKFHNEYEITLNADKTQITSFQVKSLGANTESFHKCGEFDVKDPSTLVPYYEKSLPNTKEADPIGCISSLCSISDSTELGQITSIEIGLYQYDSPL